MKTRAQIYSHEASGILREISTYGVLTQKQILGLYPQKDEQLKNLLSYLCKQKRLFLVDGAGHGASYANAPKEYESAVMDFVNANK